VICDSDWVTLMDDRRFARKQASKILEEKMYKKESHFSTPEELTLLLQVIELQDRLDRVERKIGITHGNGTKKPT